MYLLSINNNCVCRSICSAKRVVKTGARWKRGSSEDILIFNAPCLRDGASISSQGQPLPTEVMRTNAHLS